MAEQTSPEPARPTEKRSWKLAVAVAALTILPPILPFPLWSLERLWIGPLDAAAWEQCRAFYCPAAAHWETLGTFLVLGPSMLLVTASILLGFLGVLYSRRHPTLPGNVLMFWVSMSLGALWASILMVILQFFLAVAGGTL